MELSLTNPYQYVMNHRDFWKNVFQMLSYHHCASTIASLAHTCRFFWNIAAELGLVASVYSVYEPIRLDLSLQLSHRVLLMQPPSDNPDSFGNQWQQYPFVKTLELKFCIYSSRNATHNMMIGAERLQKLAHAFPNVKYLALDLGTEDPAILDETARADALYRVKDVLLVFGVLNYFPTLEKISIHAFPQDSLYIEFAGFLLGFAQSFPTLDIAIESFPTLVPEKRETDSPLYQYFELVESSDDLEVNWTEVMPILHSYFQGSRSNVHPLKALLSYMHLDSELEDVLDDLRPSIPNFGDGSILALYLSVCRDTFHEDLLPKMLQDYQENISFRYEGMNSIDWAFHLTFKIHASVFSNSTTSPTQPVQMIMKQFLIERIKLLLKSLTDPNLPAQCKVGLAISQATPFNVIVVQARNYLVRYITKDQMQEFARFILWICLYAHKQFGFSPTQVHPETQLSAIDLAKKHICSHYSLHLPHLQGRETSLQKLLLERIFPACGYHI